MTDTQILIQKYLTGKLNINTSLLSDEDKNRYIELVELTSCLVMGFNEFIGRLEKFKRGENEKSFDFSEVEKEGGN